MGYACPVCGTEEVDAIHLANHLAVTASLGRAEHVEWLETRAPDWSEMGPEDLAPVVAEHAPEVETPEFENGAGGAPSLEAELGAQSRRPGRGSMAGGSVPEDVLSEARELTEEMARNDAETRDRGEADAASDGETATDGDADDETEGGTENQ